MANLVKSQIQSACTFWLCWPHVLEQGLLLFYFAVWGILFASRCLLGISLISISLIPYSLVGLSSISPAFIFVSTI